MTSNQNQNQETKFRRKYRAGSMRFSDYDYSSDGAYFITICTKNRENYFGKIVNGIMENTIIGNIAEVCWSEIPKHFPFVVLDNFMAMPNHVHGILFIQNVETQNFASLPKIPKVNKFGPQSKNLASIIRGFKIGVTKYATMNNIPFMWQPRFYERIIRNEDELFRIREYIVNNPLQWEEDKNNPENLCI